MTIIYTARKVNLRDNFKERVEKKLKKFERIFGENASASVIVTLEKNRQTVEITINDNGMIYRAENTAPEMNDALDKVVDILSRQIRKNKAKLEKRLRGGVFDEYIEETSGPDNEQDEITYDVCRTKNVPIKPMLVDEAILRMNMVNHQFFMFRNADTHEINVVYRRKDGTYGLLQPAED